MRRVALIAALPMELKPLVAGWAHVNRSGVDLWTRSEGGRTWIAACGGCGAAAARRAFKEVLRQGSIEAICSIGVAGALSPGIPAGSVHSIGVVIDAESGQRFAVAGDRPGFSLVSSDAVAGAADKRRLSSAHGAALVDMEAAEVARLALDAGIPFSCIKGVSDGLDDPMPPMNRFLSPEGRIRMGGVVGYVALRPWLWLPMIRLGSNTRKAVKGLAAPVRALLSWPS